MPDLLYNYLYQFTKFVELNALLNKSKSIQSTRRDHFL